MFVVFQVELLDLPFEAAPGLHPRPCRSSILPWLLLPYFYDDDVKMPVILIAGVISAMYTAMYLFQLPSPGTCEFFSSLSQKSDHPLDIYTVVTLVVAPVKLLMLSEDSERR